MVLQWSGRNFDTGHSSSVVMDVDTHDLHVFGPLWNVGELARIQISSK